MNKKLEKLFVVGIDFITINITWLLYYYVRVESGLFQIFTSPNFFLSMIIIYFYWLLIFTFIGMYRTWFASSRFDELTTLFKASFIGIFILFTLIFSDDIAHDVKDANRFLIFFYWAIFLILVGFGRLFVRSIQRKLLINGVGRRNTIIVGFNAKAMETHRTIKKYKGLGLDVVGYVAVKNKNIGKRFDGIEVIDSVHNIDKAIRQVKAEEVIFALEKHEDDVLIEVLSKCEDEKVNLKIVPDLYDIISGQAKTSQIYGFPLIDIMPQLMPEWEKKVKRIIDLIFSVATLIITFPFTLIVAILIKLESKGPIIFKQKRTGQNGKEFNVYKFRSMVQDAEKLSGPVWSTKDDPRITKVGKFIRKVRIDEIPQMLNVLKGEMSFVGPRPERPYFVEKLSKEIPLYKRRLKVRPGITGWAQVKHKYDETIEDVQTKLRYDLFYIENMSLRMDFKIIFRTVFVVIFGKGHFE
ncbi:MAG: undecaprenyl-phosphate glucose phosphotransferase [Ignavibacteriae bacterium]|nr:undecaprenyl-phosphate glucose phosphotransferase [Ignavibacteriota bacterium]MCB9210880.1 undecaprenyl-phosphate glucose phosphotransferase [Ignavibacteriales bacterium]MCB9217824.1 undecaprenyl-phosphate glucose phosphotransferase [Ignavibacteriales bacterium]